MVDHRNRNQVQVRRKSLDKGAERRNVQALAINEHQSRQVANGDIRFAVSAIVEALADVSVAGEGGIERFECGEHVLRTDLLNLFGTDNINRRRPDGFRRGNQGTCDHGFFHLDRLVGRFLRQRHRQGQHLNSHTGAKRAIKD